MEANSLEIRFNIRLNLKKGKGLYINNCLYKLERLIYNQGLNYISDKGIF